MADDIATPVMAGMVIGILLVALFGFLFSDVSPNYLKLEPSDDTSDMTRITGGMYETRAFLTTFPDAKTNVYADAGIVEYYIFDDASSKWSDLRIQVATDNEILLTQVRCAIIHKETNTILNPETDLIEQHGKRLAGVPEFLRNELCPRYTT